MSPTTNKQRANSDEVAERRKSLLSANRKSSNESPQEQGSTSLLSLTIETRLLIFAYLLKNERPFFIGRCQERKVQNGSPRDVFHSDHRVCCDDIRHRPIQPSISRACRRLREEALEAFYKHSQFWLISNGFVDKENTPPEPGSLVWLQQTPRSYFNHMRHVSICTYTAWPHRLMIHLDLKETKIVGMEECSIYGDDLTRWSDLDERLRKITDETDRDGPSRGWHTLQRIFTEYPSLFVTPKEHISTPPGILRMKPKESWKYDR